MSKQLIASSQSHRRVWRLAWPMMISNLAVPLLGLVDTAIMGHLDDSQYLAAVGIGATFFSTLLWSLAFLKASTTGLSASAFALEDFSELKLLLVRALTLGFTMSLLVLLCKPFITNFALNLFAPPKGVDALLFTYISILIFGLPAALGTLVIIGWYIGQENARIPMVITLVANGLNLMLNLLFVLHFEMSVAGVAWGTLISQWVGLGLGLVFVVRTMSAANASLDWGQVLNLNNYLRLLKMNGDFFIRTLFLMATFIWFTRQGAVLGKDIAAVNELLKNFLLLIAFSLDGLAHAGEALMGASWASRNRVAFFEFARSILFWSLVAGVVLSLGFFIAGGIFAGVLTDLESILSLVDVYLLYIVVLPLVSLSAFFFDGVFIGTAHTKIMRNSMIFASVFVFMPVWYFTQSLNNHGLWIALLSFFAARGVGLGLAYYRLFVRGNWAV